MKKLAVFASIKSSILNGGKIQTGTYFFFSLLHPCDSFIKPILNNVSNFLFNVGRDIPKSLATCVFVKVSQSHAPASSKQKGWMGGYFHCSDCAYALHIPLQAE